MDATSTHSSQFSEKSVIWNFYNKHVSCDAVVFKTCFKSLKTPTGSNTSLIRHLEKHSNELNLYKKLKEEHSTRTPSQKRKINDNFKQTTLGEAFQKPAKFPRDHALAKEITMCIGKMMATDFQPYTIVEDYGFKQLCETMEPRYNLPSATTFSRSVIPALFDEQSKILKDELVTDIEGSIFSLTFTTDMWTSRSGEGYISPTSHYITNNFQLKKHVLSISHFPGNHTGEAISSKLTEFLHTWGLAEVTVPIYVVSDKARNIVNAVSLSGYEHIQCFAHLLQLAISDAKKGLGIIDLLASARNIVTYYSHSNVARERLHSNQKQGGFPVHELIQMVDTRWNSEYLMLSRLLEQKQPVMADLVENGRDGLSAKDWKMAEGMVQVLQPIYDATKEMCVDRLPTLPMVIPVLIGIDSVLKKHIDASGAGSAVLFAKQLKQCVWSRFPEYKENKVYRTVMMLDPRFKASMKASMKKT
ncbi:zinc finger BED domain-containing protein 4-like [Bacillus rossius redtenbacheri]|uniref:zinc finger BED domain-containing protein 4-like n=1 Tax=Bacillus rossius redtenbacheri TaxID=93214 RepID=UPI002FDD4CD4